MTKHQFQHDFFNYRADILDLPDASLVYKENFLESHFANELYHDLLSREDWIQEEITVYGKKHLTPRLSIWVADSGLDYGYSNMKMEPQPWSKELISLKKRVEQNSQHTFNSVLLNYYRNGRDSNGWHSDDEVELGRNPTIASVSLGAQRDFKLRYKKDKNKKVTIPLKHGSLLTMTGKTQHYWQHSIPKRVKCDARINLTFRQIKSISP